MGWFPIWFNLHRGVGVPGCPFTFPCFGYSVNFVLPFFRVSWGLTLQFPRICTRLPSVGGAVYSVKVSPLVSSCGLCPTVMGNCCCLNPCPSAWLLSSLRTFFFFPGGFLITVLSNGLSETRLLFDALIFGVPLWRAPTFGPHMPCAVPFPGSVSASLWPGWVSVSRGLCNLHPYVRAARRSLAWGKLCPVYCPGLRCSAPRFLFAMCLPNVCPSALLCSMHGTPLSHLFPFPSGGPNVGSFCFGSLCAALTS